MSVTIYSADWCGFCHMAKRYFDQLGVKYEDKNIETDLQAANEAVEKSGQRGIPVIDIDGKIIVGFNRPEIDIALANQK